MKGLFSICLVAVLSAVGSGSVDAAEPGIKPGIKAPRFSCPVLGGAEPSSSRELLKEGRVIVLSFFHTACKPCITEIPELSKVIESFEGKPVSAYLVFVGTEDSDTVRSYLKEHGFILPVLMDRHGLRVGEKFGVVKDGLAHVPQIVVISKNGMVKAAWRGFSDGMAGKLSGLLAELVEEKKEDEGADTVTILFTGNTNGMTVPAMGTGLGGLARRATVFARERKACASAIVLDCGDILPPSEDEARSRAILGGYAALNYDAIAIGESEFINGLDFIWKEVKSKRLPFVSGNVKLCLGDACLDFARSYRVVNSGRFKAAVYSYMHPDAVGFAPESRFKSGEHYMKFIDPAPGIKGFIEEFGKGGESETDLTIVLSHAGIDADRQMAQDIKGINVIVGGHSQTFMTEPVIEGGTVIVHAGADGQYVGKLVLRVENGLRPLVESFECIRLDKDVPEDPRMKSLLAGESSSEK